MSSLAETLEIAAQDVTVDKEPEQFQLSLVFARDLQERTYLKSQYCRYPCHICRVLYMDPDQADIATVYLQSSAGGLFAHDRLANRFVIESNARAHVTTQSSVVAHRMRAGHSSQRVEIIVADDSYFEYMPDPLILFPEADVDSHIEVTLGDNACVLISDSFLTHDPGLEAEPFRKLLSTISAKSHTQKTLFVDHFELNGADFNSHAIGMQDQFNLHCNILILSLAASFETLLGMIRDVIRQDGEIYGGASKLPRSCGICVRFLASDNAAAQRVTYAIWKVARKLQFGTEPLKRRK